MIDFEVDCIACEHGKPIGMQCDACGGVVAVFCPDFATGQVWVERGSAHGMIEIIEVDREHLMLQSITTKWQGAWRRDGFEDEFWYWGRTNNEARGMRLAFHLLLFVDRHREWFGGPSIDLLVQFARDVLSPMSRSEASRFVDVSPAECQSLSK